MNQDNEYFSEDVPFEISADILRRNASANMGDVERARFFGLPEGSRIRYYSDIILKDSLDIEKNLKSLLTLKPMVLKIF